MFGSKEIVNILSDSSERGSETPPPSSSNTKIIFSISDTDENSPNISFNSFRERWLSPLTPLPSTTQTTTQTILIDQLTIIDDNSPISSQVSSPIRNKKIARIIPKNRLESFNNLQIMISSDMMAFLAKGRLESLKTIPLPLHYPNNYIKINSHLISIWKIKEIITLIEERMLNHQNTSFEDQLSLWMNEQMISSPSLFHFIFIGMETFSQERLSRQNKEMRRIIGGNSAGTTEAINSKPDLLIPKLLELENIFWLIQLQLAGIRIHFLPKEEDISSTLDSIGDSIGWEEESHLISNEFDRNIFKKNQRIPTTPSLCWMAMLQEIKGISNCIARAIQSQFPTISSLMQRYLQCDSDLPSLGPNLLSQIMIENRSIGISLSKKIYNCLWSGNGDDNAYD